MTCYGPLPTDYGYITFVGSIRIQVNSTRRRSNKQVDDDCDGWREENVDK